MSMSSQEISQAWNAACRDRIAGRDWIVAFDVAASTTSVVKRLHMLGAGRVMAVAAHPGIGELPEVPTHYTHTRGPTIMTSIRAFQASLGAPDAALLAALDAFDPAGEAVVIGSLVNEHQTIAGRAVLGARPQAWQDLEDKTLSDALWDTLGVPRAPCEVVAAEAGALLDAAARLETPAGTVWAGDAREGWNGGAEYTFWVHDDAGAARAAEFLSAHCDRARVQPFLEGRPCSMHGVVGGSGFVAALRPYEMLILRKPAEGRFHYAGSATTWDPPAADREAMRAVVKRVGAHLHETVGYRGAFTIDGVMTAEGFRPTELNPRYGGALHAIARCLPDLDLYLVNQVIVDDPGLRADLAGLERAIIEGADATRYAVGMAMLPEAPEVQLEEAIAFGPVRATSYYGAGPVGGLVRVLFDAETIPAGEAAAPWVEQAFRQANATWDTGIAEMHAAPEVRQG